MSLYAHMSGRVYQGQTMPSLEPATVWRITALLKHAQSPALIPNLPPFGVLGGQEYM